MFLSPSDAAHRETVAFDWASIGIDHIGADIGTLIGSGMTWQEDEFRMIVSSEYQFYLACQEGLTRGSWQGKPDAARLNYLFGVCGYGMLLAGAAIAVGNNLSMHDFFLERSGEQTTEAAFHSYASRLEMLIPPAEELLSLAT